MSRPSPGGLNVRGLTVAYGHARGAPEVLRDVDLRIRPGETVGLVGESGSGKSTLALAVLRSLPGEGRIVRGTVHVGGDDVGALSADGLRDLWRRRVKLVPQNPLPSMNPSLPVGRQLAESSDPDRPARANRERIDAMLDSVGLPDPPRIRRAYPFELSGGQQQRVLIAMALLTEPELLILDEPTTNLDVTTEAAILELVRERVRNERTAVLYVSHSLAVVAQLCDRVDVLYAGDLVERAPAAAFYDAPLHPYAAGLLAAVPKLERPDGRRAQIRGMEGRIPDPAFRPGGCAFAPRCPLAIDACREERPPLFDAGDGRSVSCIRWDGIASGELRPVPPADASDRRGSHDRPVALVAEGIEKRYPVRRSVLDRLRGRPAPSVRALRGVDLTVRHGRTLGLVGESGSGKSTFARAAIGLDPASSGRFTLGGDRLPPALARRDRATLRRLQMVFQSSEEALNPHRTVGDTLRRPFVHLAGLSRDEADQRVEDLLHAVRLGSDFAQRTPDQLSGGEKQRVAVARAFASEPDAILFDESVSGLDVSVQAAILTLLEDLQEEREVSYLFVGHDLAVVAHLADHVAVLYLGQVMEDGSTDAVLRPPYHPYTEALLAAVPRPDPALRPDRPPLQGDLPDPREAVRGCPFASRCPRVIPETCHDEPPPLRTHEDADLRILCHHPLPDLLAVQRDLATPAPAGETP
ncbi:MAG: ABC transporter ATP-binding protein [Trueperaceae bacterium]